MPSAKPRLVFCSYHSYFDPSSGAAICTRDLFELLAACGWACTVLSGPRLDREQAGGVGELLAGQPGLCPRRGTAGEVTFTLHQYQGGGVPVSIFAPDPPQATRPPSAQEAAVFRTLFDQHCAAFRPDIVVTYGGDPASRTIMSAALRRGIRVVFALHNFAYRDAALFRSVDAVLVPSRTAQEHYRKTLGLDSTVLPGPWSWQRIACPQIERRFATFVNPHPAKGVFVFARIALELGRRRPDIPFLVVEGRGEIDWLARCGLDLSPVRTIHRMRNTTDPRDFYGVSKLVLMPSLWWESFARVPVEAMINGLPVLASNRGGLRESIQGAGLLLDVPERCTEHTRFAPTAEEVASWVQTIEQLWDDNHFYEEECRRARAAAMAWHPDQLLPQFEEFFGQVAALPQRA
jgi:glycosyltransferase involved in cell wall biosynthesis